MTQNIVHDTLVFEREFDARIEDLYQAFADPKARERWGVPSSTATIIYEESDFSIGGRDVQRCGDEDNPRFLAESVYLDMQSNPTR